MYDVSSSDYVLLLAALPEVAHVSVGASPQRALRLAKTYLSEEDYQAMVAEIRILLPYCLRRTSMPSSADVLMPSSQTGYLFKTLHATLRLPVLPVDADAAFITLMQKLNHATETGNPAYAERTADDFLMQACQAKALETGEPFEALIAYALACMLAYRHTLISEMQGFKNWNMLREFLLESHLTKLTAAS